MYCNTGDIEHESIYGAVLACIISTRRIYVQRLTDHIFAVVFSKLQKKTNLNFENVLQKFDCLPIAARIYSGVP